MGRTNPTATQLFKDTEESLSRFRRALRRSDQLVLDDLFSRAHQHLAAMAYAADMNIIQIVLLAMLVEEHKEVMRLRRAAGETDKILHD
jgi:hypothetical protein